MADLPTSPHERSIQVTEAIDLARSIGGLRFGLGDPTARVDETGIWRATRTPEGPATLRV